MAIEKDTVEYSDPTPFDGSKLNSVSEITQAIRHKLNGEDMREANHTNNRDNGWYSAIYDCTESTKYRF